MPIATTSPRSRTTTMKSAQGIVRVVAENVIGVPPPPPYTVP
jgi:hypothetical protein